MSERASDGRSRRAQEAREARRAQILRSALQVFSERGYHGASVTDLAAAAGVARGTFYLYFDSKDAVFRELLEQLLGHLRAHVAGVDLSPGAPPLQSQLQQIVERILRTVVNNRALTRIIFREAVGLDAEVDARLRAFYDDLVAFIASALEVGEAMGMVRPLEREVAATSILGSVRGIVQRYVVDEEPPVPLELLAAVVVDQTLRGIGVPRPAGASSTG